MLWRYDITLENIPKHTIYNKAYIYCIYKSYCTSYVRVYPVKENSQTCITSDKNHSDSKINQKVIILKL